MLSIKKTITCFFNSNNYVCFFFNAFSNKECRLDVIGNVNELDILYIV